MTTTRQDADRGTRHGRSETPAGEPSVPAGGWDPVRAWRVHSLYAPVADAVLDMLGRAAGDADAPARILEIGGHPGALEALLGRAAGHDERPACVVAHIDAAAEPIAALETGRYDCVVAIDWLPIVSPSQRRDEVGRICQAARSGVVLLNAFDAPEVLGASDAVNALFRAAHGQDHPGLGRQLELGLPDLDAARAWVGAAFAHVDTRSVERVGVWRAAESLVAGSPEPFRAPSAADIAAAAVYPASAELDAAEPSYRKLLVASATPVTPGLRRHQDGLPPVGSDFVTLALHAALEAAGQRRAFDRLTETITTGRERDSEEFRASVASLAAEVRELEAQVDSLARLAEDRARVIANQNSTIADTERHVLNLETLLERAREDADHTAVHVRNVDALRALADERAAVAESGAAAAESRAAVAESRAAEAESRIAAAAAHAVSAQDRAAGLELELDAARAAAALAAEEARALVVSHENFLRSRGGRVLTSYLRAKRFLLGKK